MAGQIEDLLAAAANKTDDVDGMIAQVRDTNLCEGVGSDFDVDDNENFAAFDRCALEQSVGARGNIFRGSCRQAARDPQC